jgi:hypothetical protein
VKLEALKEGVRSEHCLGYLTTRFFGIGISGNADARGLSRFGKYGSEIGSFVSKPDGGKGWLMAILESMAECGNLALQRDAPLRLSFENTRKNHIDRVSKVATIEKAPEHKHKVINFDRIVTVTEIVEGNTFFDKFRCFIQSRNVRLNLDMVLQKQAIRTPLPMLLVAKIQFASLKSFELVQFLQKLFEDGDRK